METMRARAKALRTEVEWVAAHGGHPVAQCWLSTYGVKMPPNLLEHGKWVRDAASGQGGSGIGPTRRDSAASRRERRSHVSPLDAIGRIAGTMGNWGRSIPPRMDNISRLMVGVPRSPGTDGSESTADPTNALGCISRPGSPLSPLAGSRVPLPTDNPHLYPSRVPLQCPPSTCDMPGAHQRLAAQGASTSSAHQNCSMPRASSTSSAARTSSSQPLSPR